LQLSGERRKTRVLALALAARFSSLETVDRVFEEIRFALSARSSLVEDLQSNWNETLVSLFPVNK
jgi:hypothetical protein